MAFFTRKAPVVAVRGIHLDLKGVPPTPRRLLEILDLMAEVRLNAVLVEWEDMYPWKKHPELRNETAYTPAQVKRFLAHARSLGIEVIPLVQSFGHMENVLLKEKFKHLRELEDDCRDVCPMKPGSGGVMKELIDDILETHAGYIERFHLGGDEAWSLGTCPECRRYVRRHGREGLYLYHIEPLLRHLTARDVRPILWDDMMRQWPKRALVRLGRQADLMAWSYANDPFVWLKRSILDRYEAAGVNVWGASCFKGADGITIDVPNKKNRMENMLAWSVEAKSRSLVGVVATGWSRYCSTVAPCETIESALDMVVLAGVAAWDGDLPADAVRLAGKFLNRGRCARLAGARYRRCLEAAEALQAWRNRVPDWMLTAEALCPLVGEVERRNDRHFQQTFEHLETMMREGERLGRRFVKAFTGLIPAVWLERYVAVRLRQVRRRIDCLRGGWPTKE